MLYCFLFRCTLNSVSLQIQHICTLCIYFSKASNGSWHNRITFQTISYSIWDIEWLFKYQRVVAFFQTWKYRRTLEQISWRYSCLELCESLQKNALLIFLTKVQENTFIINKWLKEAKVQIDLWDHLLQDFSKCGLQLACIGYFLKCRFRGPFPDLLNQNIRG